LTNRGLLILLVGTALVGIGLLALNFPVFLDAYDQWGWQIKCGTGYHTNLLQAEIATQATPQSNFVDQCQSALAGRRGWTIPVAAIGWMILCGVIIELWRHTSHHAEPHPESADAIR
jgi:hypothetical protein